jgi:ubiquinone/menaquinone biosynthesis C-methylase UbiE
MCELPKSVEVYGVDFCPKMLRACEKTLQKRHRKATLIHANVEAMPFASKTFDAVFHVGAFNLFSDQGKALREMHRVTKIGGRILVADETKMCAASRSGIEWLACQSMTVRNSSDLPLGLLPNGVGDVQLSTHLKGKVYLLSFTRTY